MSKIAVVIGAGPGLGGSLAKKFAQEGMKVACVRRDADKAKEAAASIGEHAVAFPADASNADEVEKLFKAIDSKWKDAKLDLVVFNAGTFAPGGLLETAPEEFERCWRVGAFAGFLVAQQALKRFVEKGSGTLIFTGATASLRGGARFQNSMFCIHRRVNDPLQFRMKLNSPSCWNRSYLRRLQNTTGRHGR